jgi:hypothetical protein
VKAPETAWTHYWFAPRPPLRLGVARALFFGGVFVLFLRYDFASWGHLGPALWQPVWLIRALDLPRPSVTALEVCQVIWKISLVLASVGLLTRIATATALVLGLYLLGVNESWGKLGHASAHLVLIMAVLALSRCGDAFAVDAWLRRRRGFAAPTASGEHTWPIRAAWLVLASMLFAAGVAKLRQSGASWLEPETMQAILLDRADALGAHPSPLQSVDRWLASQPWLCAVAATSTLCIELSYPLVLVSRRARQLLVPSTLALFVGIAACLVLAFGLTVILSHLAFFVPWDRLAPPGWLRALGGRKTDVSAQPPLRAR